MADTASLAKSIQQIKATITPWQRSRNKPPFKSEQLVAMALLLEGHPMSSQDIFMWINEVFPWYGRRISEAFWNEECAHSRPKQASAALTSVWELRRNIDLALESYEFPSYTQREDSARWSIKAYDAVELLRSIMCISSSMKPVKLGFFDLPAELRNSIHAMVFQYPTESGLMVPKMVSRGNPTRFAMCSHQTDSRSGHVVRYKTSTTTRSMTEILDPLLTCRQFYNEAVPTFYRINHFRFEDLEHLRRRLTNMPMSRGKHLSHISVSYPRRNRCIAEDTFKLLLHLEHLRVLNLKIEETAWLKYARTKAEREALKSGKDPATAREQFQSALDMPGISILRSIRGLEEVNVSGIRKDTVLPQTVAALRKDLMTAKKANAKPRAAKRKRREEHQIEMSLEDDRMERKKAKSA